jgi:biopolymer transport protein TolR
MAGALIGKRGSGGRGRYRPMAEINVTPMVDVMLVLLIVFMVTAPMMTSGVNVDLPKTNSKPINTDAEPLTVSIKGDGSIYLQDSAIGLDALVAKLNAIAAGDMGRRIFVRGDKGIPYGQVMQVMGTIAAGGFTKVALLADSSGMAASGKPGG